MQEINDKYDDFTTNSSNKTISHTFSSNCLSPELPSKPVLIQSDYQLKFSNYWLNDSRPPTKSKYDSSSVFNKL